MQDQGAEGQDKHLHQDSGKGRGARVRGDRSQGGRRQGQERDPLGRRALQPDQSLQEEQSRLRDSLTPRTSRQHPRPRDDPGACALQGGRTRGRTEGRHHQAHPAPDPYLHRDSVEGQGARVRRHRTSGECRGCQARDRGSHRRQDRKRH